MKSKLFIGLMVFAILLMIIVCSYSYYVDYQYEREIGSYFDNARDCISPDCILEQLNMGRQAIVNNGLTEEMYGAILFKKPDNSMKFQYTHLDSIIERANAVVLWVNQTQTSGQIETMKDVYNEKMDNLRLYIHDTDRSDWIAEDTWYLKNHVLLYLGIDVLVFVLWMILVIIGVFGLMNTY